MVTLANPDTLTANSLNTFTAPAGTTLAATTTYWISVNEGITSVSNRATFGLVEGNDETGETGWSIGDGRLWRDAETKDWTSSDHSLKIEIRGAVVFCDGIWCATLTVRDLGSNDRGCGNSSTGNECTVLPLGLRIHPRYDRLQRRGGARQVQRTVADVHGRRHRHRQRVPGASRRFRDFRLRRCGYEGGEEPEVGQFRPQLDHRRGS